MAQRYDTYKDSGVQWLGEIPGHWRCVLVHRLFFIKAGGDVKPEFFSDKKDDSHPYPVYTNTKSANDIYAYTSLATCPGNSITVTGRGEIGHAIYREKPYDAIIRLLSLSPKKTNIACKFYAYFIDTVIPFTSDSTAIGQLSAIQIKTKYITLPPLSEQHSIVSYLDDKCGKIDKMLEGKQKQIELSAEMKQRIIADAVTRGINPDVKMKATNIPWLPEIPEHWEMSKVSSHFKQRNEKVSDKDYPALSVSKQGVTPQLANVALSNAEGSSRKLVRVGDYAVNSRSDRKGSCGVSKYEGSVSLITIVLEPFNIDGDYVHYLFRSNPWIEEFYRNGRGIVADLWTTNYQMMKTMYMPIPPLSEQRAIVSYITDKTSKIDSLTSKLQQEIESIKEYKQRLISDVVTGQIKVC